MQPSTVLNSNVSYFTKLLSTQTQIKPDSSLLDKQSIRLLVLVSKISSGIKLNSQDINKILTENEIESSIADTILEIINAYQKDKKLSPKFYILLDFYIYSILYSNEKETSKNKKERLLIQDGGYKLAKKLGIVGLEYNKKNTLKVILALTFYQTELSNSIALKLVGPQENYTRYPNTNFSIKKGFFREKYLETINSSLICIGYTFRMLVVTKYAQKFTVLFDTPTKGDPSDPFSKDLSFTGAYDRFMGLNINNGKPKRHHKLADRLFIAKYPILYSKTSLKENEIIDIIDNLLKQIRDTMNLCAKKVMEIDTLSSQWYMIHYEILSIYEALFQEAKSNPLFIYSKNFNDELSKTIEMEIDYLHSYFFKGIISKIFDKKQKIWALGYNADETQVTKLMKMLRIVDVNPSIDDYDKLKNYDDNNEAKGEFHVVNYNEKNITINFKGLLREEFLSDPKGRISGSSKFKDINSILEFILSSNGPFLELYATLELRIKRGTIMSTLSTTAWDKFFKDYNNAIFFYLHNGKSNLSILPFLNPFAKNTKTLYMLCINKKTETSAKSIFELSYTILYKEKLDQSDDDMLNIITEQLKPLIRPTDTLNIAERNFDFYSNTTQTNREISKDAIPMLSFIAWKIHSTYMQINPYYFDAIACSYLDDVNNSKKIINRYFDVE